MSSKTTAATEPRYETKDIKHVFTAEELADLNVRFRQSYQNLSAAEAEFENVKAVHKAKLTEAAAKMETLNATIGAGFEMRETKCRVVFDAANGKKSYWPDGATEPALVETMTAEDFELDLLTADSAFESREDIAIFDPTPEGDSGKIVVGKLGARWYSAARIIIGKHKLIERMDSEQVAFKKRADAVRTAAKRAQDWLVKSLGKETAKGFETGITAAVDSNKEREE